MDSRQCHEQAGLAMTQTTLAAALAKASEHFEVGFEPLDIDGIPLEVLTVRNMPQYLDRLVARKTLQNPLKELPLWAKVWPASLVLGRFMRHLDPEGTSLLEIGAGCGIAGCIAARYGFSRIVVSDIAPDALHFAQANVLRNGLEDKIEVRHLDIVGADLKVRFDRIMASEILYLDELHRPLLKFVTRHLAHGGKAVFCSDVRRRHKRFAKLSRQYFDVTERLVGVRSRSESGEEERRVYIMYILEGK